MFSQSWLADIVIVNDSADWRLPSGVLIFRNFDDARGYCNHWAEEQDETSALFATGDLLIIGADEHGNVRVDRREPISDGQEIVKALLKHNAAEILHARRHRSTKRWGRINLGETEQAGVLPETIEGLIAYIGLTR